MYCTFGHMYPKYIHISSVYSTVFVSCPGSQRRRQCRRYRCHGRGWSSSRQKVAQDFAIVSLTRASCMSVKNQHFESLGCNKEKMQGEMLFFARQIHTNNMFMLYLINEGGDVEDMLKGVCPLFIKKI